jgi:VWFA-related protein
MPYPRRSRGDGRKVLERIATETGGRFFEISKKQTIEQVYSTIQEELRSQYSLGYTPDRNDIPAGYRAITVTAKNKDLNVQARQGYYGGQ